MDDDFPHHVRPVLRGGDYYLARYFCEGLAVVVRGDVFCFASKADAETFRQRFGSVPDQDAGQARGPHRTKAGETGHAR